MPGRDGVPIRVRCYNCNKWGHYANQCPTNRGRRGAGLVQIGLNFSQNHGGIPKTWVLLDTCSTASVACNSDLVTEIQGCSKDEVLTIYTNGGSQHYEKKAKMMLFPLKVHFNSESMAKILAFSDVANMDGVYITMDTRKERSMIVHFEHENRTVRFNECAEGLYYHDMSDINDTNFAVNKYSCLQCVKENKKYVTSDKVKREERARKEQGEIGWTSTGYYKFLVSNNLLTNSTVTLDDINRAEIIMGQPTPLIDGTMVRRAPTKNRIERVPLPLPIAQRHKEVQLYIDFFFINGYPFLHTKSEKINFITATICSTRGQTQIIKILETVR